MRKETAEVYADVISLNEASWRTGSELGVDAFKESMQKIGALTRDGKVDLSLVPVQAAATAIPMMRVIGVVSL